MGSTKKGLKLRRLVVSEIPNPWLSEVQKEVALQSVILSGTVTASSAAPESLRRKQSGGGLSPRWKSFSWEDKCRNSDYEMEVHVKAWGLLASKTEV